MAYWEREWSTDLNADVIVNITATLRIPNYAIFSHIKDSYQHKDTSIQCQLMLYEWSSSVYMFPYCTHRANASPLSFAFRVSLWTFVLFCSVNMISPVWVGVKQDSMSEGMIGEVKSESHCNIYPSLLFFFYVHYALCILTTIKGIETFSARAIKMCFI